MMRPSVSRTPNHHTFLISIGGASGTPPLLVSWPVIIFYQPVPIPPSGSAAMDIPNYTYGLPYVGTLVEVRGKGTVGWTTSLNSLGEKECILKEETPSSKSSGKFTKYLPPYYSYNKRYETSYGHAEVTAGFGINKKLSLLLDVATEQEAKTVVWAGGAICKCFDLKLTSQAEVHGEASLGKAALFYAVIYNAESIAVKLSKWGWKVINLPSPGDPVPVPGY